MEVKTDPAGRIFDIFNEVRGKSESAKARQVWSEVFGVPENDTGAILKMLAELIQLINETKLKIERIEDIDQDLYIQPFQKLEKVMSQINLDSQWKQWKNHIDDTTIYGLRICSDKLSRISSFTDISSEEINNIKESLSELTDQISESDLHVSLKELLIKNLERLRQALISYKIKGIEGIEQEVELNFGSLILHQNEIKDKSTDDKHGVIWRNYFEFLDRVNKTVSLAKNIKQIGGKEVFRMLGFDGD